MSEDALRKKANALYWDSAQSVNHIAEEMDLSKGRLYELIAPLPTATACPECSAMTHYANRTAREKATATCPECGYQGPLAAGTPSKAPAAPHVESEPRPSADDDKASHALEFAGPPADSRVGTRVWVGAALLGAAVGLFVMTRRRR